MASRQASPTVLLILLCVAVFLVNLSVLMLGPLLVALAQAFQTSVALVGQLAAATAITWGITAPLAGPVSDAYGRRRVLLSGLMLMALGMLGSVLAWHYRALLTCRLLTGVGAATVTPSSLTALAEVLPPTGHGVAGHLAPRLVLVPTQSAAARPGPGVLCPLPGGRLPRHGLVCAGRQRVPANGLFWDVGLPGGLSHADLPAAHRRHRAPPGAGWAGRHGGERPGRTGRGPSPPWSLVRPLVLGSGLLAVVVFTAPVSPWVTVALACGAAALAIISSAVTPTWLLELAGHSRTTATGLFTMSNQLGVFGGAALGGLMLAWGGFARVGLFCLGVSVIAAVVIHRKGRDSAASLAQMALRQGTNAAE